MEMLGTRVVRGPDWKWENQDGGEGCVGTVVKIGQDKKSPVTAQLVWVQWDCGNKANYRAGVHGKHDLRVLDSANGGVRHIHVLCDGCNKEPIVGTRWHCLTCPNFDLCTTCYMADTHDVEHQFGRIDQSRGRGVEVGARRGSVKVEARGMFSGAKVVRGEDWDWKDQDGGANMEGVVIDVTSWTDESARDAVRVKWKEGQRANIYRLGKDGKVDLKCTMAVTGGSYYRDHLPLLTMELKKSQSGFTVGDKVIVQVTAEKLQELSAGHGEWNADMKRYIGKAGIIKDFVSNGDVLVEYPNKLWRYNPAVLTKIQRFKRGDDVTVKADKNLVKELQDGHGGWNEAMVSILGRTGKVLEVDGTGDLVVSVEGDKWMLNPAAVTYVTDPEPGQTPIVSEDSNEDPLGLFRLFRDLLMHHAIEQGSHHLVNACRNNQISKVREILDSHPEMIDAIEGGHSALHVACHEGHCDVIRELIDRGANKETLDTQGYTAIHHSTYGDKTGEALKLLLEKGFNPNVQHNDNKSTPLHLAVKNNNEMAVRILTQNRDCDVNLQDETGDTPLYDAIAGEKHNMVDMLLDNPRISLTVVNQRGFNYLQFAVLKGNKQVVEKLLANAGDILNVAKSDGFTTLHIAAINDHREVAMLLLKQPGCLVDAPTKENQTALHLAASEGYSHMAKILLDHGAYVDAQDNDMDTPLHITLTKESMLQSNFVAQLPALHLLLRGGNSGSYAGVSRCLLNYGADVRRMNGKGETPLDKCEGSEVEHLIREIAASTGTGQVKKVPSFGGTTDVDNNTEPTVSSASNENSSASSEVEREEANIDSESPSGKDDEQCSDVRHQEQNVQLSNEVANQEEDAQERNEEEQVTDVPLDNNLLANSTIQENIIVEVTNQVQQELSTAEVSNNSSNAAVQVEIMNSEDAVNDDNGDTKDNNCPVVEAQPKASKEHSQQETTMIVEATEKDVRIETEDKKENPKCHICEENEADVAFKPCGHIVVCTECASRLKRCLECHCTITGKAKRDGTPITGINDKSLTVKYHLLEGKMRKLEEAIVCCICVERKKNVIFLCGHGTCQSCAEQLKTCPICQKQIEKKIPIF